MNTFNDNDIMFIERFLHAFKTLGGNDLGLIDYEEFKSVLKRKCKEEEKQVLQLIEEERHVKDSKLDFVMLCISILSTKKLFYNFSVENGKVSNCNQRVKSNTFTRKKASVHLQNKSTTSGRNSESGKCFSKSIKGLIFNLKEDMLSNQYQLELFEDSSVKLLAKPYLCLGDSALNIPIETFIFQDNKNKQFITSSSVIDSEGYCTVEVNLKKGKYIIIPVLLKWRKTENNTDEVLDLKSLMNFDEDTQIELTPNCEKALRVVFDCIDLDGNRLLNQSEFDIFIQHTSGETAAEEWTTVEDNFKIENHQLTFQGFLELYRMVLQTDPEDVINMLQRMGMNASLELENAQPFILLVKSTTSKFNLSPLLVSSYGAVADKVLRKLAVEHGSSSKVKNMNDLFLFTHQLPHRVTIVVQNQSHSKVTVRLDCSRSQNCVSNQNNLDYSVHVPQRSSMVGHHLFKLNPQESWKFECTESLRSNG